MGPNSQGPIAMLQYIAVYYVFATLAPQKHPKRPILAILSATPLFGVKIGAEAAPCTKLLKPNDARKGYHEPTMSNKTPLPSHKVHKIMRTKAKKAPMCSVSL